MKPGRNKQPNSRQKERESDRAGNVSLSPERRRWFRVAAVLLIPLLFLLMVEIMLRLFGIGYPTAFFIPREINGKSVLVENHRFGWRFFPRAAARAPRPSVIPAVKAPGTCRVFVFGESAAYGDPKPEFGLPRVLETILRERFPENRIEVVNVAMTAINSHVILPIARDCAKREGDVWVIYMGNNEVVGPFGAGTVFGRQVPSLSLARATIALKRSKLVQSLDLAAQQMRARKRGAQTFTGMDMFSENRVSSGDPRMKRVYSHFQQNLEDIIAAGNGAGAKMILCSVGTNLKDCAPFASVNRQTLRSSEKAEWEKLFQAGAVAQKSGNDQGARESFRAAVKRDESHAESLFRLAQCELALNNTKEAERLFIKARDEDALRFRADSRVNQIIRDIGAKYSSSGVRFLDFEEILARESSNRIVGAEFLYEHVHFNFAGNYLAARAMAEQVGESLPLLKRGHPGRWLTPAECAERLAFTDWNRLDAAKLLRQRTSRQPFTYQLDHEVKAAALNREIQQLIAQQDAGSLAQTRSVYQRAVAAAPQDWVLRESFARVLYSLHDLTGAVQQCEQVVVLLPHHSERWYQLGLYLEQAHRRVEAARAFEQALKLDPRNARASYGMGLAKFGAGSFAEAKEWLNRSLEIDPDSSETRVALGQTLVGLGKGNEALIEFRRVLMFDPANAKAWAGAKQLEPGAHVANEQIAELNKLVTENPNDSGLHLLLGKALIANGQLAEAKNHFAETAKLDPSNAEGHYFLAQELARENANEQAIVHFSKATELRPAYTEAHFNLGVALARARRFSEALAHFETTLRLDPNNALARQYASAIRAQAPR